MQSTSIQGNSIAVCVTRERRIAQYNSGFADLTGVHADAAAGWVMGEFFRSEADYIAVLNIAEPLLASGKPFQTEMYWRRLDGSDIWVNLVIYPENSENPDAGSVWIVEDRSTQKYAEDALKHTRDELSAIFDNAAVGILFTLDRKIRRCNHRLAEIFGYAAPEEIIGQPARILYPDAQSYGRVGQEAGVLLAAGQAFQTKLLGVKSDGCLIWCKIYAKAADPGYTERGTVWIVEDITESVHTEEALQQTARHMSAIMDNAPVGIFFTVARRLTRYNRKCADMVGLNGDEGIGMRARDFFRSHEEYQALSRAARPLLSHGKPFQSEIYLRSRNGGDIWVNIIAYIRNPRNTSEATIWIIEDHTLQKREAERVQFLATHDALTGLSNRLLFDKMMVLAIQSASRYRRLFAVLFVDLDGFKQVNDTLGHDAGDMLLREIADRLVQCVRASDVVARQGGDEFVILVHEIGEPQQVLPIARKILDALSQPVTVLQSATGLNHECRITASIGISLYPGDGKDERSLMKSADIAMYKAKQQGKNKIRFFSDDIQP